MKLKKMLTSLGMTFVFVAGGITANAANVVEIPSSEIGSVYNQSVQSNAIEGWVQGPQIYSESGIVMDMDSGAILYAKNIDDQHYPASITKILTAVVALEHNELTDIVTIQQEDVEFLEYGDAYVGLTLGEQITMEDAMHGMLLASGNEVSHAIGSNTEGGYENFLKLMNDKAKELGCTNSNFMNTYGLHDPEHYTSARDMALISAEAFKNEDFRRITNTIQYTIPMTNLVNETRTVVQNHKMLYNWHTHYYEYCVGGKTGYTDQALTTLVTFATKGDMNLVAVVMRTHGGGTNAYVDTTAMLDYAFENFSKVSVTRDMVETYGVASVDSGAYVLLPTGITFEQVETNVELPTAFGDKTGKVMYTYKGQAVGEVGITITDEYYKELHEIEEVKEEKNEPKENNVFFLIVKIILGVIFVIGILFLLLLCYATYRRKQIQKRRKAQRRKRKRQLEYQRYVERMQNNDK